MSKESTSRDLCICKICICGRHHCPHQPFRSVPTGPCTLSEYTNEYKSHPLYQVKSFKPAANYSRANVPLEDKTNHRIDYIPHPLEKRYVHQRDPYKPSDGDFEKTTTYTSEFNPKHGERAVMFKRMPEHKDLGKFEGIPTYKNDYPGWPVTPREVYGKSAEWVPPKETFNGLPTYSSDYVRYQNSSRREMFRPNQEIQISNLSFQDMTENRESFVPHSIEPRKLKEQSEWVRPAVPFTGESTFTSDYKENQLTMNKSFKPPAIAKLSSEPLQSETTHNSDYKPWGIEKPYVHQASKYIPPTGVMVSDTTYLRDYLPRKIDRVSAFRPKDMREVMGEFNAKTSYSEDFQKWNIAARRHFGPNREYVPSDTPFETKTTHGTHFVPMPLSTRQIYKQNDNTHLSNAPFSCESTYRSEYVPRDIDICPTTIMGSPQCPFEYTGEMDEKGHLLVSARKSDKVNNLTEVAVY